MKLSNFNSTSTTTTEKEQLEKYAVEYFIKAYSKPLKILKHSDKPDFTLIDEGNKSKIGIEVAHLWNDKKEAKILLGRSRQTRHGIMCANDLIKVLNILLSQKASKIKGFAPHDKFFLVIRVASPVFDKSTFDMYENDIICPENEYNEIWLVLDDNNKSERWSELKCIKSDNII